MTILLERISKMYQSVRGIKGPLDGLNIGGGFQLKLISI
jgi:hypothetical protein